MIVHVNCPHCGTENFGSALECEKCHVSLVNIQRNMSSEEPVLKREQSAGRTVKVRGGLEDWRDANHILSFRFDRRAVGAVGTHAP